MVPTGGARGRGDGGQLLEPATNSCGHNPSVGNGREGLEVGGSISMSRVSVLVIGGEAGVFRSPLPRFFASDLRLHLLSRCPQFPCDPKTIGTNVKVRGVGGIATACTPSKLRETLSPSLEVCDT